MLEDWYSHIALAAVGAAVAWKVVWELHFSPLGRQKIPGPKLLAVSNAWYQLSMLARRRTFSIHDLFERYGPVVRVGSGVVAFRDVDVVKDIYRTHRFRKSSWYHSLTFGGIQNSFSTSDPTLHSRCRKFNGPAFRSDNLRKSGNALLGQMDDLVMRLRTDCQGGKFIDMIQLFPRLTLDILGLTVIGARFDQVKTGRDHEFAKNSHAWLLDKLLLMLLPPWVGKVLGLIPLPALRDILRADQVMTDYAKKMYDQADVGDDQEERSDMMYKYKTYRDAETGEAVPLPLIISDIGVFMMAGMETTAMSFVYMAYGLARDERMWATLRAELDTVDYSDPNFVDQLRGLAYLDALNKEILRVYGPVSVFLERVVPPEGAVVGGYFIPGGTLIGGQAYSAHRDERLFPKAHIVDPERWVRQDTDGRWVARKDVTPEMQASYFPFGVGVRACSGRALAEIELVLVAATMVGNFRMFLHESTTPDSMRSVEVGSLRPNSGRCLVRFEYEPIPALVARESVRQSSPYFKPRPMSFASRHTAFAWSLETLP